ncbi:hypothetical protein JKL49_09440 [Phenylobacterium sp. 20VBR1]|uniref:MORN repeat-containing protein n=1 Tax=Phenylobacterium glaciei TaxID=2803784 RepID=A0A941HVB9_9CAUL|nr:hypothetical protein [Phenylobacterium glaciei]MBR7619609.1 hypothetical protein [Phenylobacterium glaciei]
MIRILLTAAALLAAGSAQAQAPGQPKPAGTRYVDYAKDPHWVVDPLSKCAVYNTRPDPAITVRWAGPCVNGMAEGKGIIVYSRNNRFAAKYDGGVSGGARNGRGVYYTANFDQLSVNWKDGLAEGLGEWTYGDKSYLRARFYRGEARGDVLYRQGDWDYNGPLNDVGAVTSHGGSPRPARLANVPYQQPRLQNPDGSPFGF